MNRLLLLMLVLSCLGINLPDPDLNQSKPAANKIGPDELKKLVNQQLGNKVNPADGSPNYSIGDFNGDGHSDIAIMVSIEDGRDELKSHGVKYVNADPYSRKNGTEIAPASMGHKCLGLAFIHGTAEGWNVATPAAKFLIYDCFSSFKLFSKNRPIRRGGSSVGPTPKLKGDAVVLDLESGATALVYWNGTTYRGFGVRSGD